MLCTVYLHTEFVGLFWWTTADLITLHMWRKDCDVTKNLTSLFHELVHLLEFRCLFDYLIIYVFFFLETLVNSPTVFFKWCLSLFAQDTLRCVGAAIPVALGYAQTTRQVKKLPKGGFRKGEALWRRRHRWAAQRLCGLMTEFRE